MDFKDCGLFMGSAIAILLTDLNKLRNPPSLSSVANDETKIVGFLPAEQDTGDVDIPAYFYRRKQGFTPDLMFTIPMIQIRLPVLLEYEKALGLSPRKAYRVPSQISRSKGLIYDLTKAEEEKNPELIRQLPWR